MTIGRHLVHESALRASTSTSWPRRPTRLPVGDPHRAGRTSVRSSTRASATGSSTSSSAAWRWGQPCARAAPPTGSSYRPTVLAGPPARRPRLLRGGVRPGGHGGPVRRRRRGGRAGQQPEYGLSLGIVTARVAARARPRRAHPVGHRAHQRPDGRRRGQRPVRRRRRLGHRLPARRCARPTSTRSPRPAGSRCGPSRAPTPSEEVPGPGSAQGAADALRRHLQRGDEAWPLALEGGDHDPDRGHDLVVAPHWHRHRARPRVISSVVVAKPSRRTLVCCCRSSPGCVMV